MIHFSVNGKETNFDNQPESLVQELIESVRLKYNSDSSLISSIKINGNELLDSDDEAAVENLKVGEIDTMEVITAHPRELAEETLQALVDFTGHLELFSKRAAAALVAGDLSDDFDKLLDGIQTFTEALLGAKGLLRITEIEPCNVLEADLSSILHDLVEFQEQGHKEFVIDLMQNHLPLNLEDWRREGIPALIRSRDS